MKVIIKRALKKDWPTLAKLHRDFTRFHYKVIDKVNRKYRIFEVPFTADKFFRLLKNKNKLYIIAKVNKGIIGLGIATVAKKKYQQKKVIEGTIVRLYVANKFRGQGISTLLRKKIYRWFKSKKVDFMDICVYATNEKAINIYKEWGFKPFIVVMEK